MAAQHVAIRSAVYELFTTKQSWKVISNTHNIPVGPIRCAFASWMSQNPNAQPTHESDIHISRTSCGLPPVLSADEERTIAKAIQYYAENNTSLSKQGVRNLVQQYVFMLLVQRQSQILFFNHKPSKNWVARFTQPNNLAVLPVNLMEDKRVNAKTPHNLAQHIARLSAAMNRFNIHEPNCIFNTEQSGASFEKMKGRSLRKGFGGAGSRLLQKSLTTNGNLDRFTVMSVVSACGKAYKPVIVFSGILAHYRTIRGKTQTLHSVLPHCYIFQRNPPSVYTNIVFQWAQLFVEETKYLRVNNQKLMLLLDGYGSHIQYKTLKFFKYNNVVVIALPAHTSHATQPLDVSFFSSYKSFLQSELHKAARQKTLLNAFDVGQCIHNAYCSSHTSTNIPSGFQKTGIWDQELLGPNIEPLERHLTMARKAENSKVSMHELLTHFERQHLTLLRDAVVQKSGHVRIDTSAGSHVTSSALIEALHRGSENLKKKQREERARRQAAAYKEPKKDMERLIELAAQRSIRRNRLAETRRRRLHIRRELARAQGAEARTALLVCFGGVAAPDSNKESDAGLI